MPAQTRKAKTEDPYATLGVARTATEAEIKKAYRRLVRSSHPDINPDDPEAEARFVRISAAYDLLKDPATRARFDAGEIDASGQEVPQRRYYRDYAGPGGPPPRPEGFSDSDAEDFFARMFTQGAGASRRGARAQGPDHHYTLEVPFLDAARGGKARITLADGGGPMDLSIPAGLRDGQSLRLRGKGGEGFGGGPRGDAIVTVTIQSHPFFRREDDTILVTLPITLDEAVLGARVQVPTIHGDVALTIPPGSSSGRILRLRGRGVHGPSGQGDQRVELRVVVPKEPDPELTAFLEAWRKTHPDDPRKAMLKGAPR